MSDGPRPSPLVALQDVSKVFPNGAVALQSISLEVADRDFVSVLGPSGCGKSTLLRIAAGLTEPGTGSVRYGWDDHQGGPSASASQAVAGRIGFVFQDPTLLPWADLHANVSLPLRLHGLPRPERDARVAQALELVELRGFERAFPRELSGGMRMRASLARALVQKPRLLLLDEPFAALDEITRFRLNDDLLRLWRHEGWTVVFVTHSVFESVYLSQRVVVMTPRPGRVAAEVLVDLPLPRGPELRTSPPYAGRCRQVSELLSQVMNPAAPA